jgi:hypothetical protein
MCRRAHSAAFVPWFGVPYPQFRLTAGEDQLVRRASSDHGTRSFCGTCGSQLFCESTNHPGWIDVTLASMEGPIDREPEAHFFIDDRAAWTHIGDGLPRFGGPTGTARAPKAQGRKREPR